MYDRLLTPTEGRHSEQPREAFSSLSFPEAIAMSTKKRAKKSPSQRQHAKKSRRRTTKTTRRLPAVIAVDVPVPERRMDVITEKTYVTTEPEVEIRKPATLAQALTEPAVAVVKPKSTVRKQVIVRRSRPRV
jgi:hypothetical protein